FGAPGVDPFASITFDYEPRPDTRPIFLGYLSLPRTERLKSITTPVGTYSLTYLDNDSTHMLPSRLSQIDYCVGMDCLLPLKFEWQGGGYHWREANAY